MTECRTSMLIKAYKVKESYSIFYVNLAPKTSIIRYPKASVWSESSLNIIRWFYPPPPPPPPPPLKRTSPRPPWAPHRSLPVSSGYTLARVRRLVLDSLSVSRAARSSHLPFTARGRSSISSHFHLCSLGKQEDDGWDLTEPQTKRIYIVPSLALKVASVGFKRRLS